MVALTAAGCGPAAPTPPAKAPVGTAPKASQGEQLPKLTEEQRISLVRVARETLSQPMPRELKFVRVKLEGWEVLHEVKRLDVRDTKRDYDASLGAMTEVPVDGTTNPAKVLQNAEWEKKAEALAQRDAALAAAIHRRFREMFAEPLQLPPMPADLLPFSVEVLWDRQSFDEVLRGSGAPVTASVRATWLPRTSNVLTYTGDESLQSLDEWACAGGRVQKASDQAVGTACAALLLREYAAVRRGYHGAPGTAPALSRTPPWFRLGLPAVLGGVESGREDPAAPTVALVHDRVVLSYVDEARRRRDTPEEWTLAQLLHPRSFGMDNDNAIALVAGEAGPPYPEVPPAFRTRAWAFCHFLWNYDGGKYRDKVVAFTGRVLDDTGTSDVFAKEIMGRPSAADWGEIEMEFEWYWSKLLERLPGPNPVTREPRDTMTDAPEGEVDPGFREMWEQNRAAQKQRPK